MRNRRCSQAQRRGDTPTLRKRIIEILGFQHLNISLIDGDRRRIRTRYVGGTFIRISIGKHIPKWQITLCSRALVNVKIFKRGWSRTKWLWYRMPTTIDLIELWKNALAAQLVRVFVPMVVTVDGAAIGTVEAGFARANRPQVFERDVQILRQFVDYGTAALDQSRKLRINEVIHELRLPLVGIRNNVDYMEMNLGKLTFGCRNGFFRTSWEIVRLLLRR